MKICYLLLHEDMGTGYDLRVQPFIQRISKDNEVFAVQFHSGIKSRRSRMRTLMDMHPRHISHRGVKNYCVPRLYMTYMGQL